MHVQELKIVDHSGGSHELPKFIGLYKNCRNIKKLTVESSERDSVQNFRDFLPFMTQLEEFYMDTNNIGVDEKLQAIRDVCLNLKMLKVKEEQTDRARTIFDGCDVAIEGV
jgi:hypothetical protein